MSSVFFMNSYVFFCGFFTLWVNSSNFLLFLISLEFLYLSIIVAFCSACVFVTHRFGFVFALLCLSIAAADAVVGFYFVLLLQFQKATTFLWLAFQLKG